MIQLTQAINVIHQAEIVHRDIKPENIFLSGPSETIKIGDLGISRVIDSEQNERAKTRIGTPRYVSPEVLKGDIIFKFLVIIFFVHFSLNFRKYITMQIFELIGIL